MQMTTTKTLYKAPAKKSTSRQRHTGPQLASQPRLVVQGTSSLAWRGQTLLRVRPSLMAEVKSYCVGPTYLVIEHALEELLIALKAKGVDEKPEWVDADDLAATEFDKQMLVEEGRLPKARSEFADGARGRKKAGSKDEPAA